MPQLNELKTQLNVVGLVLIGSARLSRSHTQIKNLLKSYRAGAHCNLITLEVSALYSAAAGNFRQSVGFSIQSWAVHKTTGVLSIHRQT
jgi:hypothetical protein